MAIAAASAARARSRPFISAIFRKEGAKRSHAVDAMAPVVPMLTIWSRPSHPHEPPERTSSRLPSSRQLCATGGFRPTDPDPTAALLSEDHLGPCWWPQRPKTNLPADLQLCPGPGAAETRAHLLRQERRWGGLRIAAVSLTAWVNLAAPPPRPTRCPPPADDLADLLAAVLAYRPQPRALMLRPRPT